MIPLVKSALVQFLKPITATSRPQPSKNLGGDGGNSPGPYYKRKESRQESDLNSPQGEGFQRTTQEQLAKVISIKKQAVDDEDGENSENLPTLRSEGIDRSAKLASGVSALSVAHAFIHLLAAFGKQRHQLLGWFGNRRYRDATTSKKSAASFRLGAMLDQKIE